ncbi:MAG TPA: oxygenase MpaB family protein, partial [Mycobacterium sp.]|nr:oxygenase MpaB family protein [Mycobacterium sp.]
MSMRPVPQTWEEFQEYWDRMCQEMLEDNKAARDVLDLAHYPKPWFAQWIPDVLFTPVQRHLVAPFMVWLCVGLYDDPVRELLGYSWSPRDEWLHRRVGDVVRLAFSLLPPRYRKHPRGRAGLDRASGRIPLDAALPQTPARNLPPLDERHKPTHYCPVAGVWRDRDGLT